MASVDKPPKLAICPTNERGNNLEKYFLTALKLGFRTPNSYLTITCVEVINKNLKHGSLSSLSRLGTDHHGTDEGIKPRRISWVSVSTLTFRRLPLSARCQ